MADAPHQNPIQIFSEWLDEAYKQEPNDPNAMALATMGADNMPSIRMVLLKGHDEAGYVFYTNLESRKGGELKANPKAALLFHWKSLRRQVRIEGVVEAVTDEEADEYFATRARLSQIGAWASAQSRPLKSKLALEAQVTKQLARFGASKIDRPPHWSGFRLVPTAYEFWRDGAFRLHDRWRFEGGSGKTDWDITRLYP